MLIDRVLSVIVGTPKQPTQPLRARRILVCMQAHVGDAVLASSVIPALRRAYPAASFGFLVHPTAAEVFRDHPDVDAVHMVEHAYLNRTTPCLVGRLRTHFRSRREALKAIRGARYDLAIDLYHYFPNSIPLLWHSGIAQRIGWRSGGFGPLLTHAASEVTRSTPVLERHRMLLAAVHQRAGERPLRPDLPLSAATRQRWRVLKQQLGLTEPFIALHVGAHAAHRRWPTESWRGLAGRLLADGRRVLLLGHGEHDNAVSRSIEAGFPAVINLCSRLDWPLFVAAVEACDILVAHDSAAIHVAAAFDKPRVCLAAGINELSIWLPSLPNAAVMIEPVPCAPCGRAAGCASMACIQGVTVQRVTETVQRMLAADIQPNGH
jgi:ADP-heptose:LPS heptosyltransferase